MATKQQPSVVDEKKQETDHLSPSDKEQEVVDAILHKFRLTQDNRNRTFQYFDDINLIDYINDSVRRFVTNVDERDDIESWQARVHDPFTRNKVLAILSKVVSVLPIAELSARGDEDGRRAKILSSLYEYAEDVDDYEEFMIFFLLEAIVKGTAVGFEGVERKDRSIKNVKGVGDDIEIEEKKSRETNLYGSIVPLEDFFPQSVGLRTINDMDYCFWATEMPYSKFLTDWGDYSKASFVQPYRTGYADHERPFYQDYLEGRIQEGNVLVVRYYNEVTDEYIVIANGVWMNPIKGEQISPLPWNHKRLPFWDVKFDFFGADFFYGKSLPDRLKSMQDVLNVLTNMLLDQSFLTIFPPLLTNGYDPIEDDYLRPGRRTPVDTQGLPIKDSFMQLDLQTPQGWHQYILEYTRNIMEEASVGQVAQGIAGVGGRTTAQEIRTAAEGVQAMLGLFGRVVNSGLKRKARLKVGNIQQFWTDPDSPMVQAVLGEDANERVNDAFNSFNIKNTTLTDGKRGTKIVEMYRRKKDMPTKTNLRLRAKLLEEEKNENIEIIAIESDYLRNFEYDVKIVANPRSRTSRDIEKALQLEKVRIYSSFFPDMVDRQELFAQTAEKLGDDPTKLMTQGQAQAGLAGQAGAEQDQGLSLEPQGNIANNSVRGMQGGEVSSNNLRELQNNFLG